MFATEIIGRTDTRSKDALHYEILVILTQIPPFCHGLNSKDYTLAFRPQSDRATMLKYINVPGVRCRLLLLSNYASFSDHLTTLLIAGAI